MEKKSYIDKFSAIHSVLIVAGTRQSDKLASRYDYKIYVGNYYENRDSITISARMFGVKIFELKECVVIVRLRYLIFEISQRRIHERKTLIIEDGLLNALCICTSN